MTIYKQIDTIKIDFKCSIGGINVSLTKRERKLAKKESKRLAKIIKKEAKMAKKEAKLAKKQLKHDLKIEKNRKKFMQTYFSKKMDGAEIFDKLVQKDFDEAINRAKGVLGLTDQEANHYSPLVVSLPEIFYPGSKLRIKMGKKNDHLRYNQSRISVLLFGEKQFFYYSVLINHEEGLYSDDYAVEVPYQALVSVETKSFRLFDHKSFHHFIDYQLFLVNDHSVTIRMKDIVKDQNELQKGISIPEDTQKILSSLSRFLREMRNL